MNDPSFALSAAKPSLVLVITEYITKKCIPEKRSFFVEGTFHSIVNGAAVESLAVFGLWANTFAQNQDNFA